MKKLYTSTFVAVKLIIFSISFNCFAQTIGSPTHGLPSNPIQNGYCSNQGSGKL